MHGSRSSHEDDDGLQEVFDHIKWSSTCPLLMAVLIETYSYRLGDLSSGVGMRFAPNLIDLSCLLYDCVV